MTLRKFWIRAQGLLQEHDSHLVAAVAPWATWSATEHLIKALIDVEGQLAHGSAWVSPIELPGRENKESIKRNRRAEAFAQAQEVRQRQLAAQRRAKGGDDNG